MSNPTYYPDMVPSGLFLFSRVEIKRAAEGEAFRWLESSCVTECMFPLCVCVCICSWGFLCTASLGGSFMEVFEFCFSLKILVK